MNPEVMQVLREVLGWLMPIQIQDFVDLRGLPWQEMWLRGTWLIVKNGLIFGALGWLVGWAWERHGLRKLAVREHDVRDIRVEASRYRADKEGDRLDGRLLEGSVVLSHDIFRGFTIFFSRIFGGRITMYERLFDRARREAIVRLKEDARGEGYNRIVNMKIVPTRIKRNGPATVEVLVYGTGLRKQVV